MFTRFAALALATFLVCCVSACGGGQTRSVIAPGSIYRAVPIPERDYGYIAFDSQVIASRLELDQLLSSASGLTWSDKEPFIREIEATNVDFDREALVLIRDTEPSGSVSVSFDTPRINSRTLTSTLRRKDTGFGAAVVTSYAFAFVVTKSRVDEVEVRVEDKDTIRLNVPD